MVDFTSPHRRFNPLTRDWVLVSPHRAKRPWQGTIEAPQYVPSPAWEPTCHLCPGNKRTNALTNPAYTQTYVFTNDHSALLPESLEGDLEDGLIRAKGERGVCRVICYSPAHNLTMADMNRDQIRRIIETWTEEYTSIGSLDYISYVQIFENKGPLMGASSPHPHGQIWANEHIPTNVEKEQRSQQQYYEKHSSPLLIDYARQENEDKKRVIASNSDFMVVVPFWATWPYETMILPRSHKRSLKDLTPEEQGSLADILKGLTMCYDRLFATSFPYSMGIHQAPTDNAQHDEWQMHIHFYPPLLRSATIKKYFVGYEMFAESQRDINPEDAALTLRKLYE
jgi:UDPglucose--hexose-1-phosphate uridylyltransferase